MTQIVRIVGKTSKTNSEAACQMSQYVKRPYFVALVRWIGNPVRKK